MLMHSHDEIEGKQHTNESDSKSLISKLMKFQGNLNVTILETSSSLRKKMGYTIRRVDE